MRFRAAGYAHDSTDPRVVTLLTFTRFIPTFYAVISVIGIFVTSRARPPAAPDKRGHMTVNGIDIS